MKLRVVCLAVLIATLALVCASAQKKGKQREDLTVRSVQGVVEDPQGNPAGSAIVQLKNTKSLQVRSFIAKTDGTYYFNGLSTDVDYELKAEAPAGSSSVKTLSRFDSRRQAVINLKLESKP